jgi:hypothetical protein
MEITLGDDPRDGQPLGQCLGPEQEETRGGLTPRVVDQNMCLIEFPTLLAAWLTELAADCAALAAAFAAAVAAA